MQFHTGKSTTMPSQNTKSVNFDKTNLKVLLNDAVIKINEIALDMYYFKGRSREIQLSIEDIINIAKNSERLRLEKECFLERTLISVKKLNLEIKELTAGIAEMRKLYDLRNSSPNKDINTEQITKKLQELIDTVSLKTKHMMRFKSLVESQLLYEKSDQENIPLMLKKFLERKPLVQPVPENNNDSITKPSLCLSDTISEMNKLKVSFESDKFLVQLPKEVADLKNQKESLQNTDLSSNTKASAFGTDQTTPKFSFCFSPKNSFESFQKPFIFKLPDGKTDESHSKGLTSNSQPIIFGATKPTNSSASQPNAKESSLKFTPPTIRPFQFVPVNKNINIKKTEDSDSTANLSASVPNTSDTSPFSQASQLSFKFTPPDIKPSESIFENIPTTIRAIRRVNKTQNNPRAKQFGTEPKTPDIRTKWLTVEFERETYTTLFYNCISMKSEYKDKSLEELRLENYLESKKFKNQEDNNFPRRTILTADFKTLTASHARAKFSPWLDSPSDTEKLDRYQSITFMNQFKKKSFEELRLGDYIIAGVIHPKTIGSVSEALNVVHEKYQPTDDSWADNYNYGIRGASSGLVRFHCITLMLEYFYKSYEELRLLDYAIAGVFPREKYELHSMGTACVKFSPTIALDTIGKDSTKLVEVKYQFITAMKEYNNKSLEELRLEDYFLGRKGHKTSLLRPAPYSRNVLAGPFDTLNEHEMSQPDDESNKNKEITNSPTTSTDEHATSAEPGDSDKKSSLSERLLDSGETEEAVKKYSDEELEDALKFMLNRAGANYNLKMYRKALRDAQQVVGMTSKFPTAYVQIAKCYLALGEVAAGEQTVRQFTEPDEELSEAFTELRKLQEKARRLMSECKYYDTISVIDDCLRRYCPGSSAMKIMKAECFVHTNKFQEARSIAVDLSILSSKDAPGAVYADAMYIIGLCHYKQEQDDLALKNLRKAVEHDPDHEKAVKIIKLTKTRMNTKLILEKKEQGNKAFMAGQWKKALKIYDEALSIDKNIKHLNAKLYYNKAVVCIKQDRFRDAIAEFCTALELDETCLKALARRAECYTKIKKYEEAFEDYERLYNIESTDENKRLLNKASEKLKANLPPYYYYKILGVNKSATLNEIKKAYRKCALLYHPDKHAGASTADVSRNERKFKQVKEACETLQDPRARANYDRAQARKPDPSDNSSEDSYDDSSDNSS